jgi:hypothetical protein
MRTLGEQPALSAQIAAAIMTARGLEAPVTLVPTTMTPAARPVAKPSTSAPASPTASKASGAAPVPTPATAATVATAPKAAEPTKAEPKADSSAQSRSAAA